jgi:hypothetical protein
MVDSHVGSTNVRKTEIRNTLNPVNPQAAKKKANQPAL